MKRKRRSRGMPVDPATGRPVGFLRRGSKVKNGRPRQKQKQ